MVCLKNLLRSSFTTGLNSNNAVTLLRKTKAKSLGMRLKSEFLTTQIFVKVRDKAEVVKTHHTCHTQELDVTLGQDFLPDVPRS